MSRFMPRFAAEFLLAAAVVAPALCARSIPTITAATPACLPTTTLDELVKAVDDAVSGPANKDRACFRALFAADARLIPLRIGADGSSTPRVLSVQDWIDAVAKRGNAVFYERQVKVKSEVYGHMAHLWSTYDTRSTPDGKADVRGINSIQALYDGKRWRIVEILWQAETTAEPVPEKYLP
jgi:hypothetical protein